MALKNQILTTVQPTISLKELSIYDVSQYNQTKDKETFVEDAKEAVGVTAPLIMVNGVKIEPGYILSMTLFQDSFLPSLKITFVDKLGMFSSYHNPVFDPLVSVYVKSQSPNLKPLRGDYLITNMTSIPIMNEAEHVISLDCELYIPNIYSNVSKSYPNMTSVDCLKKVAGELGLGFATNEESTDDKMTWLNPNMNYLSFIKDEVTNRAYKSDNSFFTCFIDRYYILNFINVEKQMEQDTDFDMTHIVSDLVTNSGTIKGAEQRAKDTEIVSDVVLSNHPSMQNNSNFIREFWPISNNGEILKNQSFRNRVLWYETTEQKVNSFFIEPLSTNKTATGSEHQVPIIESLRTMEVKKWLGFDYGNAHKHNKFARMLNHHNNLELNKNIIVARVSGFNSSLLRGIRLPVVFYDESYVNSIKNALENKNDGASSDRGYFIDDILSDIYYIKDIVYKYETGSVGPLFYTEFILSKRNWKKTTYNNA